MNAVWLSVPQLVSFAIPGLPATKQGMLSFVDRHRLRDLLDAAGNPMARRRKGRGGGWEFRLEAWLSVLSPPQALLLQHVARPTAPIAEPEPAKGPKSDARRIVTDWDHYNRLPDKTKQKAQRRAAALDAVNALTRGGLQKNLAVHEVAKREGVGASSVYNWLALVAGVDRPDWLPHLSPRHQGRTKTAECSPEAWDWYKGHYLTRARPTHADSYARLKEIAAAKGWTIPSARTLERRIETEIDPIVRKASREGIEKAKAMLPSQERDARVFAAGEAVNGDGLKFDRLWVRFPDGEIVNTATGWFWQDIRTRRILAWRLDKTENTDVFRLATYDLTGVCAPAYVWLDNTTVAANKLMTASAPGRHRFHNKAEDGIGLLQMLGAETHFTNPDKETGNPGAKPIERAFGIGGIHEAVATHPSLIGRGYSKATAIDADELREVIAHEVGRHNAKTGRRTQMCGGVLSFDQAWTAAVAERAPRVLSESQRRLLLMSREIVRADRAGVLALKAGSGPGGLRNRYWTEACARLAGRKVAVHFDPKNLHAAVHVYALDGRYLFSADPWEAAGFGDTAKGREYGKFRRQKTKALKKATDAESRMDALTRAALYAEATRPPEAPAAASAPAVAQDGTVVHAHFRKVPDPARDARRAGPTKEEMEENFRASVAALEARHRERL